MFHTGRFNMLIWQRSPDWSVTQPHGNPRCVFWKLTVDPESQLEVQGSPNIRKKNKLEDSALVPPSPQPRRAELVLAGEDPSPRNKPCHWAAEAPPGETLLSKWCWAQHGQKGPQSGPETLP